MIKLLKHFLQKQNHTFMYTISFCWNLYNRCINTFNKAEVPCQKGLTLPIWLMKCIVSDNNFSMIYAMPNAIKLSIDCSDSSILSYIEMVSSLQLRKNWRAEKKKSFHNNAISKIVLKFNCISNRVMLNE